MILINGKAGAKTLEQGRLLEASTYGPPAFSHFFLDLLTWMRPRKVTIMIPSKKLYLRALPVTLVEFLVSWQGAGSLWKASI
jgi:hypothetical protein